jgi:hypothetical protein
VRDLQRKPSAVDLDGGVPAAKENPLRESGHHADAIGQLFRANGRGEQDENGGDGLHREPPERFPESTDLPAGDR